ncbi:RecA-family ATPase [Bradyrhizobium sp. AZCC 1610]|uniref:AAA family ATPase n=1 Tax=Bradyrhizobium sp. AZCC 1610 TaxID=3117020 RepID=UPI002FF1EAFD
MLAREEHITEETFLKVPAIAAVVADHASPQDDAPMPSSPEDYGLPAYGEAITEPETITAQVRAPLRLTCPPDWRGIPIPPMRWLATNRIPADDVTILSGDGGGGKTTISMQLAVSVACDLGDWLGTTCEAGPVIFFSGEEPENEIRRRLARVSVSRGLHADDITNLHFHFAEPDECILGTGKPTCPITPTPLFESLFEAARQIRPVLIIVDSNAATLGGNYLDRVHARTFVSMFRRICREINCSVVLLDHPSLSGMTNGSGRAGNMDWQNAVRAFSYLRSVDNGNGTKGRELEIMKTNYGPPGEKVRLRWEDGCYVQEGTAPSPRAAAAERKVDDLFLRLLAERNAQGRHVTPSKAAGYAPKELAAMPSAEGCTASALANAMERLLAAGEIAVERTGPPTKQRARLVVGPLPTTLPTAE